MTEFHKNEFRNSILKNLAVIDKDIYLEIIKENFSGKYSRHIAIIHEANELCPSSEHLAQQAA